MSRGTFTSQENKGFLWNLLYRNGTFNSFNGDMVGSVKTMFEATINEVAASSTYGRASITDQNKEVLRLVTDKCKSMANGGGNVPDVTFMTSAAALQMRQKTFNKNLESRKQEFESSINAAKPKAIDFSDEADKPIGSEMDSLIADAIARRKSDLSQVMQQQDPDAGSKWINKDSEANPPAPSRHIQIGEELGGLQDTSVEEIGAKKRVTFDTTQEEAQEEAQEEEVDWLSMLKTKDVTPPSSNASDTSSELERRLSRIEEKMDTILQILRA